TDPSPERLVSRRHRNPEPQVVDGVPDHADGGLAGALDDRTGALLIATTATVAVLGIFVWGYLHRSRYPLPPRPRRVRQEIAASATAAPAAAALPVSDDAGKPAAAIAAPDAESEDGAIVPAMALNGDHGIAVDAAPATDTPQPDIGNGAVPGPAAGSRDSATDPDEDRPVRNDWADSSRHEPADAAETHPAADRADNIVAFVAPGARASGSRPLPPDDDDGFEHH
ncbi:MAG: hypothetical protein ACRDJC_10035, partial [Thermomicrobiales bacterium]